MFSYKLSCYQTTSKHSKFQSDPNNSYTTFEPPILLNVNADGNDIRLDDTTTLNTQ